MKNSVPPLLNLMKNHTVNKNTMVAFSNNSELIKIRLFIEENAINFGFAEDISQKIALAVDEACSNLIKHAYKSNDSKKIWINVENSKNEFIVKILDEGEPFNPLQVPEPDMNSYFRKFKRGGLGIQIIKLVMDKIKYFPSDSKNTKNILEMRKILN